LLGRGAVCPGGQLDPDHISDPHHPSMPSIS
jgi:hypothetical protein